MKMGNSTKRNFFVVGLVFLIFFVISLLTNVTGPMLPDIIKSFGLSLALGGFIPTAFFLAYGVMSIPAGILIEKFDEKPVLVASFILAFLGSALFISKPIYVIFLFSLFTIGIGMAMLQVAINPLLRVAGGEEHYAFYGVMAQLIFGLASFFSPKLYSYLVTRLADPGGAHNIVVRTLAKVVPPHIAWSSMYWIFTVVTLFMVLLLAFIKIPRIELKEEEKAGTIATHLALLKRRIVWLFFLGTFCYVGTEQGVSFWISKFLQVYHNVLPTQGGDTATAWFWGLQTIGCVAGLVLLKLFDSRRILIAFGALGAVTLAVALTGSRPVAMIAFPLVGFWTSVMWATIFALALNSVDRHHGSFSGILCTGIIGGAVMPWIVGKLGDSLGLRSGMLVIFLTLAYIISIGFWAKPLITNATIGSKKKIAEAV
jgi:MFS transporter, FHS family, L-fucose permease